VTFNAGRKGAVVASTSRSMRARSVLPGLALAIAVAGCASRPPALPSNVTSGSAAPLPSPAVRAGDAPPRLIAANFSSLVVRRGQSWSGRFVTSTNVASVEVRTNLFSIDVPREAFGRFAFSVDLLDAPSVFVRKYALRVIARNSAGGEIEEDVPFEIR
jgi:predicted pyridoxine 5'-phosphate oxidase superfamily flavin-nucleotide-binding protein